MVCTPSYSELYLCIQPSLQSPSITLSYTSVNFHVPILPLLVQKIILTIPTNTPHTSANFQLRIFLLPYNHSSQQSFANSGRINGPGSKVVLWGLTLFWSLPCSSKFGQWQQGSQQWLTTTDSLLLRLRKLVCFR